MVIIEFFIFLSTLLPIFHMINAIFIKRKRMHILSQKKRFSVLIPCYNEEDTVRLSINGLLKMDYNNYEAIYINDGSADNTLAELCSALDLYKVSKHGAGPGAVYRSRMYPDFFAIDKPNGGKSEALNLGLCLASSELVVTLDADSVLKNDALQHMSHVFEDPNVVAAGGSVHIIQGYHTLNPQKRTHKIKNIVLLQILEYLKGFYIYKMSLSKQRAMAIISGAFGVFRKDILIKAGGYRRTLGEDIDITLRIQKMIHKTAKKIVYLPSALCYTQCPENWGDLKRQRIRWQKGFIDCVVCYKGFLLKTFLSKSLSFHFLVEAVAVGICSCLFTIFTYVFIAILAFADAHTVLVFSFYYVFCLFINIVYSLSALAVSSKYNRYPKHTIRKAWVAIALDILFYRFFNLIMYLGGTAAYFWNRGGKNRWNKITRTRYTLANLGGMEWTNSSQSSIS